MTSKTPGRRIIDNGLFGQLPDRTVVQQKQMEQRSSKNLKEQRSNRHMLKLQPGLPCWTIQILFSKLKTFPFKLLLDNPVALF